MCIREPAINLAYICCPYVQFAFDPQILVQDVRSVHQGRGMASNELYECYFDGVMMHFFTTEEEIHVVSAEAA